MLVPNSTSTVSLLSAKGRDILTSLGSPGPEMASDGQDRADALGWGRRPNRPKTFARNPTIPHKSYRCFYLRQRSRAANNSSEPIASAAWTQGLRTPNAKLQA